MTDKNINPTEYIKFINENINLTKCAKDIVIEYFNTKYLIYSDAKDEFQINYYYKKAVETNNKYLINNLEYLFLHLTNIETINIIIKKLNLKKKISDYEIIQIINKSNSQNRQKMPCNKWDFFFQNLALKYFSLCKTDKFNYLDIGCADCRKSMTFAKYLGLKYKSIYGCDIPYWGPYKQDRKKPLQFALIKNNKLPYSNNFFQLISVIFTLHHIKSLKQFLKEIYRITKPGGYLVIVEHDTCSDYDKMLVDFIHKFFAITVNKKMDYDTNPDYMITYNRFEWEFLLTSVGFKYVCDDVLYFNVDKEVRYDKPFYSYYQKSFF